MKKTKQLIEILIGLAISACLMGGCGKSEIDEDTVQGNAGAISRTEAASGKEAAPVGTGAAGTGAEATGNAGAAAGTGTDGLAGGTEVSDSAATVEVQAETTLKQPGWIQEKDGWHLYDDKGQQAVGWKEEGENWYYFDQSGVMQIGWLDENGSWFFLGEDGAMRTDWQVIEGKNYYFDKENGAMQHDRWEGEYYLGSDGILLTDMTTPDGYYVGVDGRKVSDSVQAATANGKSSGMLSAYGKILTEYMYGYHALDTSMSDYNDGYAANYDASEGRYKLEYLLRDLNKDGNMELIVRSPRWNILEGIFTVTDSGAQTVYDAAGEYFFKTSSWLTDKDYMILDESGDAWTVYQLNASDSLEEIFGRGNLEAAEPAMNGKLISEEEHEAWEASLGNEITDGWKDVTHDEIINTFGVSQSSLSLSYVNPCSSENLLNNNKTIAFNDSAKKYFGYSLNELQSVFGSYKSNWDNWDDPKWDGFLFGDGDTIYYTFEGTDLVFAYDDYSNSVCGVISANPHHFFNYDGEITIDMIENLGVSEDIGTYDVYAPELASVYKRKRVYLSGPPRGDIDIDYAIADGRIRAIYMWS